MKYSEYIWGVVSATVMLVLVYLIVPIDGRIEHNRNTVQNVDVRLAVVEKSVESGFKHLEKNLDRINEKLDKLMADATNKR